MPSARFWRFLLWAILLAVLIRCLSAAEPEIRATTAITYPPLSKAERDQMDAQWRKFQRRLSSLTSRELFGFVLTAAAKGWRPDQLPAVLDLAESMHDRDPASRTYGNYRWYLSDPHPDDLNAVEFCMQPAVLAWALYRDRLVPAAREKLAAALALGVEGCRRAPVKVDYTNIFLMRIANCILIGEQTGRPEFVALGRAALEEWLAYTRAHGIHEFSSPTYYGVDLEDLAGLALYCASPGTRARAEAALRLLWTDIAANWFEPHQGIGGAYSRDYGFLTGHGFLDQQLLRARWIPGDLGSESRPVEDDLLAWPVPADVRAAVAPPPRFVSQQYGPHPAQRASHFVGRHFSLGSAGESYGAQDRMLALHFDGGPKDPIGSLVFDYRADPYGSRKIATSGGHAKLTHLNPFVASVQRGPEVLMLASFDPAHFSNPAGKNQPMAYEGVQANWVFPSSVTVEDARGPVAEGEPLPPREPLFLRRGDVGVALCFLAARNEAGTPAALTLSRDGLEQGAQRLVAILATGAPQGRVSVIFWVRAAEGLDDDAFHRFCAEAARDARAAVVRTDAVALDARIRSANWPAVAPLDAHGASLHVAASLGTAPGGEVDGLDPLALQGILNVNGRDLGGPLLREAGR